MYLYDVSFYAYLCLLAYSVNGMQNESLTVIFLACIKFPKKCFVNEQNCFLTHAMQGDSDDEGVSDM